MKESSSIAPAAHHSALFLIQDGISEDDSTGVVIGVLGVSFTRLEPISINPEPIPEYFGL